MLCLPCKRFFFYGPVTGYVTMLAFYLNTVGCVNVLKILEEESPLASWFLTTLFLNSPAVLGLFIKKLPLIG